MATSAFSEITEGRAVPDSGIVETSNETMTFSVALKGDLTGKLTVAWRNKNGVTADAPAGAGSLGEATGSGSNYSVPLPPGATAPADTYGELSEVKRFTIVAENRTLSKIALERRFRFGFCTHGWRQTPDMRR